jgi:hypothetical protein
MNFGNLRAHLRAGISYNFVHFVKKKKPFVETKGSNDCLPYESANVSQLYFSCINSVLKNVKYKCLYNVC